MDSVAVEFLWSAIAKIAIGTLAEGSVIEGHIASFLDFEDGLIISQRS